MYDKDIRHILRNNYPKKIFVDEVNVGKSRIDLIDLSHELHGIEIKSAHDTFNRLKLQSKNYNKYLSKISILVHESKEEDVLDHVPHFWGILIAKDNNTINIKRKALPNPYCNKKLIITLLWKEELLNIISTKFNTSLNSRYSKLPKWKLINLILKEIDLQEAISLVKETLIYRLNSGNWR